MYEMDVRILIDVQNHVKLLFGHFFRACSKPDGFGQPLPAVRVVSYDEPTTPPRNFHGFFHSAFATNTGAEGERKTRRRLRCLLGSFCSHDCRSGQTWEHVKVRWSARCDLGWCVGLYAGHSFWLRLPAGYVVHRLGRRMFEMCLLGALVLPGMMLMALRK